MSYQSNTKVGSRDFAPHKKADFAAAKMVPAAIVADLLEIRITGSGNNLVCAEHDIRGSDRSGYLLWWQGSVRVGDNVNLVQLLRPGTRAAAAVEMLMGGSPINQVAHVPKAPVVLAAVHAAFWSDEDLAQALLDADEMADRWGEAEAMSAIELAADAFDELEQATLTQSAFDSQQGADEFAAQEHAYAAWSTLAYAR